MSSSTSVDDVDVDDDVIVVDEGRRRWRHQSRTPMSWLLLSHGKIKNIIFLFRWERQVHYRQQEALRGSEIIAVMRRISCAFIKIMLRMLEGAMLWFLQKIWHLWEVERTFHINRTSWNRSTILHLLYSLFCVCKAKTFYDVFIIYFKVRHFYNTSKLI